MFKKNMNRASAIAIAVAAFGGSAVYAQDAKPAETTIGGLDEIIVTAERRSGNLQTVPIAVSALSTEMLENVQIGTTQELQKIVPGLRMTSNITSPTNFTIALRGSIQQDASIIVTESPVGIYVDDIYIPRLNGANAQLADLERIEVLRGPQGTLYGRNALSGAMKFVSRTPGEKTWLDLNAGYGTYDRFKVSGSAGGALAEDLYGSVAMMYNGTNGYYENVATDSDFGRERNFAARAKLRYTPGNWDIIGSVSYARSTNDAQPMIPATVPGTPQFTSSDVVPSLGDAYSLSVPTRKRSGFMTDKPYGKTTQIIASLNASYDLDFATLRSITGFVQTKDFFTVDLSGQGFIDLGSDLKSDAFSEELQLLGTSFDGKLDWMAGVYYFHEKADQNLLLFTSMLMDIKTESVAAFGQGTFKVSDAFSITGGLRWTEDKKRFTGGIRALDFPYPNVDFTSKDTYRAWTPKLSLNYEVPTGDSNVFNSMLLYASVARGFKSGGYNGIPVTDPGVLATVYGPETNWTYEAGVKTELLNRRLRVNAAYFISEISDLTANATVEYQGTLSFPVSNVADATVKGLELEITAVPVDDLNIFANATFQTGKYSNIAPGSAPADAIVAFGKASVPQLPDYTFTVGFDYGVDVQMGAQTARLKIGGDWYRTGKYSVLVNNDYWINAYSRLNGFVAVELNDRYEFRVAGTNLADKTQFVSGSRSLGGYILLPPREVMATLSFKM